ncbi:hypothetical protein Rhopal_002450-T1 [Rhodotorula paludigena]|uniref:Acid phosphatase n=1 Tax=Rhodotorula paludigena TaxID=86838 RepID=A0AAV5GJS5_9BASI|nr:hypothetical protein Rhopal_002450-T1 [Rhodotorula paludigena]
MVHLSLAALASSALLVSAGPVKRASSVAASDAGVSVSDVYPPTGAVANPTLFPDETQVGYPGPTPTGVEPFAVQTAASYPTHTDIYPLVVPAASDAKDAKSFDISKYWGNLSPQYSVNPAQYGLANASPAVPDKCEVVQAHLYFRHGARYPTTGAPPSTFAGKVQNATQAAGGFTASGPLAFLNDWTYKLGAELLTPFGRKQNFDFGVASRQLYGKLLNNFTEAGTIPVMRTQSQDRMVKTMLNFVAGFFGVPEYQDQVNIEIELEARGFNLSGAPYEICTNSNNAYGSVGSTAATAFTKPYYEKAAERLNKHLSGNLTLVATDINAMLQLCSYETDALGYSSFCPLFTEDEFRVYEQAYDIQFAGNNGFQSPVSAAQGKAYLEELISRLNHSLITEWDSATNATQDGNEETFPLNQSLYADAAHEVSIMDALTALNLTALTGDTAFPPVDKLSTDHVYGASRIVPFGTQFQLQVLECQPSVPTKQIRMIVNDAVVPLSYPGCKPDPNGLCAYDTVLAGLIQRRDEIDFDHACFGNYTLPEYGSIHSGLAPSA